MNTTPGRPAARALLIQGRRLSDSRTSARDQILRLTLIQYFHYSGIMKTTDAVTALAALSQESRLELFRLLVKRGPDGYSPGDLMEKLDIPGPTLSFHLKALTHAGLVAARKESRFIYYSPNFDRVNELVGFLTEHCCSLSSTSCDTSCTLAPKAAAKPVQKTSRRRA